MKIGLVRGRHNIDNIKDYVFDVIEDVTDLSAMEAIAKQVLLQHRDEKINLYVTGLTVACATCIKICVDNDIELSLWHYNNATNTYFEQKIVTIKKCSFCGNNRGHGWHCQHCGSC